VHTARGKDAGGVLYRLDKDWTVRLSGPREMRVPGENVISIRRNDVPLPANPTGRQLILANGDHIPFEAVRLDGERLFFLHPGLTAGKEADLPLAAVALLWLEAPETASEPEALRRRLTSTARGRDQVLLRNGDVLEGVLSTLDSRKVEVDA